MARKAWMSTVSEHGMYVWEKAGQGRMSIALQEGFNNKHLGQWEFRISRRKNFKRYFDTKDKAMDYVHNYMKAN